jgi:ABC-type lipoprotein export system ATPase subunit
MTLFRRINITNKQTLILVTHNRWIAEKCDYIIHMTDGQVASIENAPFAEKEKTA